MSDWMLWLLIPGALLVIFVLRAAYDLGVNSERSRWIAAAESSHYHSQNGDFFVMPRGKFWDEYHNPLMRARRTERPYPFGNGPFI